MAAPAENLIGNEYVPAAGNGYAPAPVNAVVQQLVETLMAGNRGRNDYAELGKLIAELAGLE